MGSKDINLEAARQHCEHDAGKVDDFVRTNVSQGRFVQAVGLVGECGAGAMLSLAMMDWIIDKDPEGTRRHLLSAAAFIPRLGEPAVAGGAGVQGQPLIEAAIAEFGPLQGIHRIAATAHMRDGPFCLLAAAILTGTLAQHLPLLRRLDPLIREHNDDDYSSLDALGLLAFAAGDVGLRAAFAYRVERYLKAKWLKSFFRASMAQIQALQARDQAALDAATEQAAKEFLLRAKDKKTLGRRVGLGMYSHIEFDLCGTCVGKLARLNGMRFDHDSRAMPLGVVRMFE